MDLEEFEHRYRDLIDDVLNQLQTLNLLAALIQRRAEELNVSEQALQPVTTTTSQLEAGLLGIGGTLRTLSLHIEAFIQEQRSTEL